MELDSQVDSTVDHFYLLLIQHGKDTNTMRAKPTRVIANRDFDEFQKLAYLGVVYCKVKKDRKNWFGLAIFAIRLNRKKEGRKERSLQLMQLE